MANIQAHCRFCGSDKVDTYRALNGIIVYECDACWRIWNSSKLKKVTNPQTEQERQFTYLKLKINAETYLEGAGNENPLSAQLLKLLFGNCFQEYCPRA